MVIISQDQTDHCHEPTLRQLDPNLPETIILAAPTAAKKIKSWKYFDPSKIHAFEPYSEKRPKAVMRFYIPAGPDDSGPGEATICFITEKRDMTGLHNAVGITYRPPTPGIPPVPPLPVSASAWQSTPSKSPTISTSPYPRDHSSSFHYPPSNYPPSPPETPSLRCRSSSDLASSYPFESPPSAVSCDTPATARSVCFGRTASHDSFAAPPPPPVPPTPKLRTLAPRSATKSTPDLRAPQPWPATAQPAANNGSTRPASRTHSRASSSQSQNFSRPFSTHRRHASSVGSQAAPYHSQPPPQPPSQRTSFDARPYTADPSTHPYRPHDPYHPTAASLAASGALDPRPVPASARTTYTRPRALSLLYSPHGLAASALHAYAAFHLVPAAALPLTALLHPFNQTRNPWYLGGVVIAGLPGGLEVARLLGARTWVSAHDGEKEQGGWAVRTARTRRWGRESVRRVLEGTGVVERRGKWGGKDKGSEVDVRSLGVGEEVVVQAG